MRCYNNFRSIVCQVVAYGRLKAKENFKLYALKVVAIAYKRWSFTRCFDLETFGILENWSLEGGPPVFLFLLLSFLVLSLINMANAKLVTVELL